MNRLIAFVSLFFACNAFAQMPSNPERDPNFLILSNGKNLKNISVSGSKLDLSKGSGENFGATQQAAFEKIKKESRLSANHPVQWVLMDLDSRQVVDQSAAPNRKQFGASVSKIFVAGALLDHQQGSISDSQLDLMCSMLVVSSNTAWVELQRQLGGGSADRGRELNLQFTQRMGYQRTRGFQGTWGTLHGNELTPAELAQYLYDTYQNRYSGAEAVWKIMHTSRTGSSRAKKYLPVNQYVGGKTGTYDGPTIDPETGSPKNPDGSAYTVKVRHHVLVFNLRGREFGLAILSDTGTDETAALLAGGIYRELLVNSL